MNISIVLFIWNSIASVFLRFLIVIAIMYMYCFHNRSERISNTFVLTVAFLLIGIIFSGIGGN